MYAYEVSCPGENLLSFSEGTQSTNKNENRCGYGAVLPVMAGQMYNQQHPEHIGMSCMTECVMHMPIPKRTDT